jgi:hypothetical protein
MGLLRRLLGLPPKAPPPPPWPRSTVVVDGLDHPAAIAVGATDIWFGTGGFQGADNAIRRVPLTGGPTEIVARSGGIPSPHLVLAGDLVVWTDEFGADGPGGDLCTAPAAGGGPVTRLAPHLTAPRELVVEGDHVYFLASGLRRYPTDHDGDVGRVPLAGGAVEVLAAGQTTAHELFVADGALWWSTVAGVHRTALAGGDVVDVHRCGEHEVPGPSATDGEHIYVVLATHGKGALHRIRFDGSGLERISPDRPAIVFPIQVAGDHVYWWGEAGLMGYRLCRSPKAGGETEELDRGTIGSGQFAIAHGALWWTDITSIRRTPVPA